MANLIHPNAKILRDDLRRRRVEALFLGDSLLAPGNAYNRPATKLMNIVGGLDGLYKVRRFCVTPEATSSAAMGYCYASPNPDWLPVDNLGMTRDEDALYAVDSENRWSFPCSLVKFETNSGANWALNGFLAQNQINPTNFMGKSPNPIFGASGKVIARILYFGHPSAEMWDRTTRIHHTGSAGLQALKTDADFTADALGRYQDGEGGARSAGGAYAEDRLNAYDTDYVVPVSTSTFTVLLYDATAYSGALGGSAHGLTGGIGMAFTTVWQDADASGNAIEGNGLYVAAGASWGLGGFAANTASSGSTTSLKQYPRQQMADFLDLAIYDTDAVAWFVLGIDWAEEWARYVSIGATAFGEMVDDFIAECAAAASAVGMADYRVVFWQPYYHRDSGGGAVGGGTEAEARENFRTLAAVFAARCAGSNVCMVNAAAYANYALFDGAAEGIAALEDLGYDAWAIGGTYGGGDGIVDATAWDPADADAGDLLDANKLHPSGLLAADKDEQVAGLVFADLFRSTIEDSPGGGAARNRSRSRARASGF